MNISGWHHVTNIAGNIVKNHDFYTRVLGLRLLKKSVNQDDVSAYHTFFGDEMASAGNALTFFDFHDDQKGRRGTNSISSVGLRVTSDAALDYWKERFVNHGVSHSRIDDVFGHKGLRFTDIDGLELRLISDEIGHSFPPGVPNTMSDVPDEFAIVGLSTQELTVVDPLIQEKFLIGVLGFRKTGSITGLARYETGGGGNAAAIHVYQDSVSNCEIQGSGCAHHIALRIADSEALEAMQERIDAAMYPNSGIVERFWFKAIYVRVGRILYEFATDQPGFTVDEPLETLGEKLILPPFLEHRRGEIEGSIAPFDTTRVDFRSIIRKAQ